MASPAQALFFVGYLSKTIIYHYEIDIDECTNNPQQCYTGECTNTVGGFECGECPVGYDGDGIGPNGCAGITNKNNERYH